MAGMRVGEGERGEGGARTSGGRTAEPTQTPVKGSMQARMSQPISKLGVRPKGKLPRYSAFLADSKFLSPRLCFPANT
jgi:hypothetical protein